MTSSSQPDPSSGILIEQALHNASLLHKEGRIQEAEELYLAVLTLQDDHPEANFSLGTIAIRKHLPVASLPYFEKALDKRPDHGPFWIAYIDALDQAGKPDLALETLNIALQAGLAGDEADALQRRLQPQAATALDTTALPPSGQKPFGSGPIALQAVPDDLVSLYNQGQYAACEALARSIVTKQPEQGLCWKILGGAIRQQGRLDEAIAAMRQAVRLLPDDPESLNNLGIFLENKEQYAESESVLRQALAIKGDFVAALNSLGVTLISQGRFAEAEDSLSRALRLQPEFAEACCNLGISFQNRGMLAEAVVHLQRALAINPASADYYNNLGNAFNAQGRLSEAEGCLRKALELRPDFADAHKNLGSILLNQGYQDESSACYRRALELKPDFSAAFDDLLFVSNYDPEKSGEEIFRLYQEYDNRYGVAARNRQLPHTNTPKPSRRLRVGYVSPVFCKHPVANFLLPLLDHHDPGRFEVFAYSETVHEDALTAEYKQHVQHWISTIGLSDDELAARIRRDQIDILVDLAGHTGRNRLKVFARKPSPVSLHWLDFGYTTGLSAIDYYPADITLAPLGSENLFSEQIWRLPCPPFAYRPTEGMGAAGPLPAEDRGYVTFGTLTRVIRINARTLRAWSAILRRIPASRLVIDSGSFKDPAIRQALIEKFAEMGIEEGRLDIGYHSPPWDVLRGIDICLDCFPHNSGTTLFESLYMGIPFLTLAGRPSVGTLGASILEGLGHPEWIAQTEEQYIDKAVALASDLPALAAIRSGLRRELQNSPLMDEQGFARQMEEAYRRMFARWCATAAAKDTEDIAPAGGSASPQPETAEALYNTGTEMQQQGRLADAQNLYIQALNIRPDFAEACNNLGVALQQEGRLEKAEAAFHQALRIRPDYADAWFNLANTYKLMLSLGQAEAGYRKVIAINPDSFLAHYNLGNILQEQGRQEEAESSLRQALALAPDHKNAFSTLLFVLNYHPGKEIGEIFQTYQEFNRRFCLPLPADWTPHANPAADGRRLKVAYLAPDYRKHPARYFLEPLLSHHNREVFETHAYVDLPDNDGPTDLFYSSVEHWISAAGMTDEQLAARIRKDGIDILVDLAGHTGGNRLGVMAMKPAPVSLHWLDFGYTTGLTAIDYYLTDQATVPAGSEQYFTEAPWRLATPALAYRPPKETGTAGPLPFHAKGHITFGSLTRAIRINHRTIRVWAEILKQCPGSHLVINSGSYRESAMQEALAERFLQQGIARERLEIGSTSPPWDLFRTIDIGLDCFPHNSGTTLIESLYMGVPYITLADRVCVGRLGSAILEGAGHPEFIAKTESEYVHLAVTLASAPDRLAGLRARLRQEMQSGPLMDEAGFARKVEEAYQQMFAHWYDTRTRREDLAQKPKNQKNSSDAKERKQQQPPHSEIRRLTDLFNRGDRDRAAQLARSLTDRFPEHGIGWKFLGPLLFQLGLQEEALAAMKKAAQYLPHDPDAQYNLGIACEQTGRFDEACASYRQTLALSANHINALYNLGNIYYQTGEWDEAEKYYRRALGLNPDFFEAQCNLGNILREQKRLDESAVCYRRALKIRPDSAEVLNNLGLVFLGQGNLQEAEAFCKKALTLQPGMAEAHNNLGLNYQERGMLLEADASYRQAIESLPEYSPSYNNLSVSLQKQGRLVEAEHVLRKGLEHDTDNVKLRQNMGTTLIHQARFDEAEANLRRAMELKTNDPSIGDDLLFLLNYHPDKTSREIYKEYEGFNARFGLPYHSRWKPFANSRESGRRLKVGYVSSQFRSHSTCYFLEPLLAHHDKNLIEIFAYSELINEDAVTLRYRSYADHWRTITGLSDAAVAQGIREDGIDILVDLAGHTGENRLGVFARKPAPVSLHWLDFGYTTGLTAIDYYLTDAITVPIGSEALFSETPWRVAAPAIVYRPAERMGEVSHLPALERGSVTFGTLSRAIRINHRTIRVWAEILKQVKNSRLVIDSGDFKDPAMRELLADRFIAHGIARERLDIGCHSPPWDVLRSLDIGLDCFPHNSGTTLVESLYMGVPFVTLACRPSVGTLGSSILEGLGHPEWIASSEEEYISLAVALAHDLPQLADIRSRLRQEMETGPLMDEAGFARKVETAYQQMFEQWAGQGKNENDLPVAKDAAGDVPADAAEANYRLGQTMVADRQAAATVSNQDQQEAMIALFNTGRIAECESLARSVIARSPENGFAWKTLGFTLKSQGKEDEAVSALQKALASSPKDIGIQHTLGDCLHVLGRYAEAAEIFLESLEHNPQSAESYYFLANARFAMGAMQEAEDGYRKALQRRPEYPEALANLGNTLVRQQKFPDAERCFEQAIASRPDFAEAFYNYGNLLKDQNRLEEAQKRYQTALDCKPDYPQAWSNLGITLHLLGRIADAEACYRKALEIQPGLVEAHINLGACLKDQGRYQEAEKSYLDALEREPDSFLTYSNLGSVLKEHGCLAEAEACLRKALAIRPDYAGAFSNLLFLLNYDPDKDAKEIFAEYRNFNTRFCLPFHAEWQEHVNTPNTNRRLKVGYVSPQFRLHSTRHFLEPLLAHHDAKQVEIFAYAEVGNEDEVTQRYRSLVQHWRTTVGLGDADLARQIREDGIDILVDLAGHTANNRLGVFARKPAPVSLHWLDFGYTTGLTAIDYYLTDEPTAPEGSQELFSETPWRIAPPAFVYRPAEGMGEAGPLPAMDHGHITFGTLTRAVRINHRTIRVWSEILQKVEGSRLIIDSSNFKDPAMQEELAARFIAHGIDRQRLEIGFHSPPWDVLRSLDIMLDCFPHNSGTTLVESLYMGVPYVSLAGRPSVGTLGSSILEGLGHPEWIASTEENYINLAVALAHDLPRLADIRSRLRQEMETSPLMDEAGFARKVETAYQQMFEQWAQRSRRENDLPVAKDAAEDVPADTAEANYHLGQAKVADRQAAAALPYFEAAIDAHPEHGPYWLAYIDALDKAGQTDAARQILKMALDAGLDGTEAEILKNRLERVPPVGIAEPLKLPAEAVPGSTDLQKSALSASKPAVENIDRLISLYQQGRYSEAETLARSLVDAFPEDGQAWNVLSATLRQRGEIVEALSAMKMAVQCMPEDAISLRNTAVLLYELERFAEAEQFCRRALAVDQGYADAHLTLSLILKAQKHLPEAEHSSRMALQLKPDSPEILVELGLILNEQGKFAEAEACCHKALQLNPSFAEAQYSLGLIFQKSDRFQEAESAYRQAIALKANYTEVYTMLGVLLLSQRAFAAAEAVFRQSLHHTPADPNSLHNLGKSLANQNRYPEAESCYIQVLTLEPHNAEAHYNLGIAFAHQGKTLEAEKSYRNALNLNPDYNEAANNLGNNLLQQGRLEEAEAIFRTLLEAHTNSPAASLSSPDLLNYAANNLGNNLLKMGRLEESEAIFRALLESQPNIPMAFSNFLFLLNYHPDKTGEEIFQEYLRFENQFARPLYNQWQEHTNKPDKNRRLKIGYVSPQFRLHSMCYFLEPLLARHDKNTVEVFAYADVDHEDELSKRYRSYVDHWFTTPGLSDAALARKIREDEIDVLVDLAGHTANNRLGVFARKPAPVSLHWLDFGYTTGLTAIDYYLTDKTTAPEGSEGLFSETPWRITTPSIVYRPANGMGKAGPLPAMVHDHITFGTLTRAVRINYRTIRVWSEILKRVKNAHLVINSRNFCDPTVQEELAKKFIAQGVHREQLEIGYHSPPWDVYRSLDISLDCFPHNSGTTLIESLYMGVPYISLAGRPSVGTLGSSILEGVGHPEWIARTEEMYIDLAVALAADIPRLAALRAGLRQEMKASPLMDEPGFARKMEAAYREMFAKWCDSKLASSPKTENDRINGEQVIRKSPKTMKAARSKAGSHPKKTGSPSQIQANRLIELYRQGNIQEAERFARTLIESFPQDSQTWKILGAIRRHQGDLLEALSALETAMKLQPADPISLRNTAVLLCDLERFAEAEKLCAQAIAIKPDYADAHHTLSVSLRALKKFPEAERRAQKALEIRPNYPDALINLALILTGTGRLSEAETCCRKALSLTPNSAEAACSLGSILDKAGQPAEAEAACRQALALKPHYPEAWNSLGGILAGQQRHQEAESAYRRALERKPGYPEALHNLGKTLSRLGRYQEAEGCFARVLTANPANAEASYDAGNALLDQGKPQEAETRYQTALSIKPDYPEALINLGNALQQQGRTSEAEEAFRTALQSDPDSAYACNNLGNVLQEQDKIVESEGFYRRALAIDPHYAEAFSNLGNTLQRQGRLAESEQIFRSILDSKPDFPVAFSNFLFLLNYHPDKSTSEIFQEYIEFDRRFGLPLRDRWQPHGNIPDSKRRLKIGYVSPQFCRHPVGNFLEPLLAFHDKNEVEVYAYAEVYKEDTVTERYRSYMDHWIPTQDMTDAEMAARIRSDGIDILVDLAGHTGHNRLLLFALKPAPISLHWLDFGYTTGLTAIDYYLTDAASVPAGSEELFAETPWRMPTPSIAYRPTPGMGEVSLLPADKRGHITFGSLSRAIRINHRTIRVWAALLKKVQGSHLVINSRDFKDPAMQDRLAEQFVALGVDRQCLEIGFTSPPWDVLRGIDISLDCFPHNSGTTLIESLYMGVPFITLVHRPSVGRLGCSILVGAGHPEWIAESEEQYVDLAVELAADTAKLARIRAGLRQKMEKSPLMDEPGFARRVEAAYRAMFAKWCEGQQ